MFAKYAFAAIILLLAGCGSVTSAQNYSAATEIIDSLLNNYDKRLRPNYGGGPVDVGITMYVISFSSISDSDMDFTLDFYFRQYWKDPRLAFRKSPGLENIKLGHDFGKMIWVPDTFFVNEKESFMHDVSQKNEFIKVDHSGEVTRSVRISVTASCQMNLARFPMDTQICALEIESYGHDASGIRYFWREPHTSIGFSDTPSSLLFHVISVKETSQLMNFTSGSYSRLLAEFEFARNRGSYMPLVYIPSSMLIILCWVSFWLKRSAYNVRLALCILSLLLMAVGCSILATQIPKTPYIKAIDLYTGVCMTLIFIALMAFAYICNLNQADEKDIQTESKIRKIDNFFKIAFPITFIVFNMIYWAVY